MKSSYSYTRDTQTLRTWSEAGVFQGESTSFPINFETTLVVGNGNVKGNRKSPNPFNFTKTYRESVHGSVFATWTSNGRPGIESRGNMGIWALTPSLTPAMKTSVYNRALSNFNSKVRSEIDWSINAAQANQVRSSVDKLLGVVSFVLRFPKNPLRLSYDAFLNLKRHGVKGNFKRGAGLYLEYIYGVKPLIQDVFNTMTELNRDFDNGHEIRARGQETEQKSLPILDSGGGWIGRTEMEGTYGVRFSARVAMPASHAILASNFTTMNPAGFLWEAMPYSFVADWVVDIGGYLRNMETSVLHANSLKSGFWTESWKITSTDIYARDRVEGQYTVSRTGTAASTQTGMVRHVLTGWPSPRNPHFRVDLGTQRLINAAALLSQHLR